MSQTIIIGATDPNIAYLLQRYAEESGHSSTLVSQTTEVPALARVLQPALIILDIELVETIQGEIVRQLKAEPATANIPIVIYSCLDEPPENKHEGVDGYLLKSVMYDDFIEALERAGAKQFVGDSHPAAT